MRTLQQESLSPTDKLGYSTPTYIGTKMQTHGWDASWPTFFSKLLTTAMVCDAEANSTVEELDTKLSKVCNQVIPILLGALEENGRKLKPVLIHGNLTDSRFRKLPNKEDVYFYNPSSYYSHQAMELASWDWFEDKPKWKPYIAEFKESGLASEPIEQFGGRDRLYRLKHKLYRSTLYGPGDERKQWVLSLLSTVVIADRRQGSQGFELFSCQVRVAIGGSLDLGQSLYCDLQSLIPCSGTCSSITRPVQNQTSNPHTWNTDRVLTATGAIFTTKAPRLCQQQM